MKKLYLVAVFLASSGLLNTLEGASTSKDDPMKLFSGSDSKQSEINQSKVDPINISAEQDKAIIPENDTQQTEVDQWKAEFLAFAEENGEAIIRIFNTNDEEQFKSYPFQKLYAGKYEHDFENGMSYPIVQLYIDLKDEPLISKKSLMIEGEFVDLDEAIKHQRRRCKQGDSLFGKTYIVTPSGEEVIRTDELVKVTIPVYHWNNYSRFNIPYWNLHRYETLIIAKTSIKPKIKVISSNWNSAAYIVSEKIENIQDIQNKSYYGLIREGTEVKVVDWKSVEEECSTELAYVSEIPSGTAS